MSTKRSFLCLFLLIAIQVSLLGQNRVQPELFEVPEIKSSWDDLTDGIETLEDWQKRRALLKQRYLELLRDQHKTEKVHSLGVILFGFATSSITVDPESGKLHNEHAAAASSSRSWSTSGLPVVSRRSP